MLRIGVLGTANIAERRMIPALLKCNQTEYVGVAIATIEELGIQCTEEEADSIRDKKESKAKRFVAQFGGMYFTGYEELLKCKDIDAVYIPLPPTLHYRWIMLALEYGKHVIAEKPLTVSLEQTERIIEAARKRSLAVIENYGFCYHKQMDLIGDLIKSKEIGDLRLLRAMFCFPHREESDFRYNRSLGGGALLDCGGYTLKVASHFLGASAKIESANLVTTPGHEVDIYGSATVRNDDGLCAQVSFGMDNSYKCELEIYGSKGSIIATRIFTAPAEYDAAVLLDNKYRHEEMKNQDDQFEKLVLAFIDCVRDEKRRRKEYDSMRRQADLVECVMDKGNI